MLPSFLGSPGLPDIYMSFEKTVDGDSTKTPYNRGKDMNGSSKVTMLNGANIGTSAGRPGKVLKMTGTNAGADAGYFKGHHIKYGVLPMVHVVSNSCLACSMNSLGVVC